MAEEKVTIELTKEQKKALRKAKAKKILKIVGIVAGVTAVTGATGYTCYKVGKKIGLKIGSKINTYCALEAYQGSVFDMVSNGNYASEFTNTNTGEVKYMTYQLSDKAPDWWGQCETFDLKEEVANAFSK